MKPAFAYLRTSSATNVGGDSDVRQRQAISAFAAQAGYQIVGEFYDAAVSGADALDVRPGFAAMLTAIAANGCRTIIVESASRFARDLIVQETGYRQLRAGKSPIELIAADSPEAFVHDTPTARLVRQVLGAVSEFERAAMVAKLKGARDRKAAETGKRCGGVPSHAETRPDVVALARQYHSTGLSLRKIGAELAAAGHLNSRGARYSAKSVRAMLQGA